MIDDIDQIMAIMQSAFDPEFGEAWTRRQVLDSLALPHNSYVLISASRTIPKPGENAAGFALIRHVPGEAEVLLIAVAPNCRRQGIASSVLELVTHNAANAGAERVFLEMRENNPAIELYSAHGFVPIGRRREYYRGKSGARFDAITFAKTLLATG